MRTRINKKSVLTIIAITTVYFSASSADASNLIANPSFEEGGKGWNIWGGGVGATSRSGKAGLSIRNDEVKWSGADQVIVLPEGAANVYVSGWIKTDSVVRGVETWENARISIEFRDAQGLLVGGYPPVTGQAVGTTAWTHYKRDYMVPGPARTVSLQCALGNAVGEAHFDDIALSIKNRKGETLGAGRLAGVMDVG